MSQHRTLIWAAAGFALLQGASASGAYDVYISSRDNKVYRFTDAGVAVTGPAYTAPTVPSIWGLATDSANQKFYVGSFADGLVRRFLADGTPDGTWALTNGVTTSTLSFGMDVGSDGFLYVLGESSGAHQVWKLDTNDVLATPVLVSTAVSGVTYDLVDGNDGLLYVAEGQNDRVVSIDKTTGTLAVVVPYVDGMTQPQADVPRGIDFDIDGELVTTDEDRFPDALNSSQTHRVRHYTISPLAAGAIWTIPDATLAAPDNINNLHVGLAIAPDGRTFVPSYNITPVFVFDTAGNPSIFTSLGGASVAVDILTPAVVPEPASLALLASGGLLMLRRRAR
jgi:hypothetical protein